MGYLSCGFRRFFSWVSKIHGYLNGVHEHLNFYKLLNEDTGQLAI